MMTLALDGIETGYGKKQVLFGVSLEASRGEIVALVGPNGAGKSTVLKAICGVLSPWHGRVRFQGRFVRFASPADAVKAGIGFSPQGNRVFPELTVRENLEMGGYGLKRRDVVRRMEELLELFPDLSDRARTQAGKLSGGEQQMLALARALMTEPKLMLLDEPSLGLAPQLIRRAFEMISEIRKDRVTTMLIVEQKVREVLLISDRVYALKLGKVSFEGGPDELLADREKMRSLFL